MHEHINAESIFKLKNSIKIAESFKRFWGMESSPGGRLVPNTKIRIVQALKHTK